MKPIAGIKAKPKLAIRKKTTAGQKYQLKLNGLSGRANVKWKTSNKRVSIAKRKWNAVTFKTMKKGVAVVTATYKEKKYQCRITVKERKKKMTVNNPVLSSTDVTLYHLSESYTNYIKYHSSHLQEYRFRVSGTKKEVMAYSELNIYIDTVFTGFEKQYITSSMTQREKAEKAAWYISATSDYEPYNPNWFVIFIKGKGNCMARRYALQYMCNHMGIKAAGCGLLNAHAKTLVYADGKFYVIITGFNKPKPRSYGIYEISGAALEVLADENNFDLDYFRQ